MTRTDEAYRYAKQFKLFLLLNIVLKGESLFLLKHQIVELTKYPLEILSLVSLFFPCHLPPLTLPKQVREVDDLLKITLAITGRAKIGKLSKITTLHCVIFTNVDFSERFFCSKLLEIFCS